MGQKSPNGFQSIQCCMIWLCIYLNKIFLTLTLTCEAGDQRSYRAHYDVIVMWEKMDNVRVGTLRVGIVLERLLDNPQPDNPYSDIYPPPGNPHPNIPHLALRWRHNGRDSVSNHQPHGYLLNRLFRRRSKKTSKLRVTGRGPVISPHKWPVTRKMFPFDDFIMGHCPTHPISTTNCKLTRSRCIVLVALQGAHMNDK